MDENELEEGRENSRFLNLLKPVRDLADNFNIDLARELADYLNYIGADIEDASGIDFSEAALLIQGSTCVYSKKVEHLYNLVYKALGTIKTKKHLDDSADAGSGHARDASSRAANGGDISALLDLEDEEDDDEAALEKFWSIERFLTVAPTTETDLADDEEFQPPSLDLLRPPAMLVALEAQNMASHANETRRDGEQTVYRLQESFMHVSGSLILDAHDLQRFDRFLRPITGLTPATAVVEDPLSLPSLIGTGVDASFARPPLAYSETQKAAANASLPAVSQMNDNPVGDDPSAMDVVMNDVDNCAAEGTDHPSTFAEDEENKHGGIHSPASLIPMEGRDSADGVVADFESDTVGAASAAKGDGVNSEVDALPVFIKDESPSSTEPAGPEEEAAPIVGQGTAAPEATKDAIASAEEASLGECGEAAVSSGAGGGSGSGDADDVDGLDDVMQDLAAEDAEADQSPRRSPPDENLPSESQAKDVASAADATTSETGARQRGTKQRADAPYVDPFTPLDPHDPGKVPSKPLKVKKIQSRRRLPIFNKQSAYAIACARVSSIASTATGSRRRSDGQGSLTVADFSAPIATCGKRRERNGPVTGSINTKPTMMRTGARLLGLRRIADTKSSLPPPPMDPLAMYDTNMLLSEALRKVAPPYVPSSLSPFLTKFPTAALPFQMQLGRDNGGFNLASAGAAYGSRKDAPYLDGSKGAHVGGGVRASDMGGKSSGFPSSGVDSRFIPGSIRPEFEYVANEVFKRLSGMDSVHEFRNGRKSAKGFRAEAEAEAARKRAAGAEALLKLERETARGFHAPLGFGDWFRGMDLNSATELLQEAEEGHSGSGFLDDAIGEAFGPAAMDFGFNLMPLLAQSAKKGRKPLASPGTAAAAAAGFGVVGAKSAAAVATAVLAAREAAALAEPGNAQEMPGRHAMKESSLGDSGNNSDADIVRFIGAQDVDEEAADLETQILTLAEGLEGSMDDDYDLCLGQGRISPTDPRFVHLDDPAVDGIQAMQTVDGAETQDPLNPPLDPSDASIGAAAAAGGAYDVNGDDGEDEEGGVLLDDEEGARIFDLAANEDVYGIGHDDSDGETYGLGDDAPTPMRVRAEGEEPSYEELCRLHMEALLAAAAARQVQSNLAQRVGSWRRRIDPVLVREERRDVFDMRRYGGRIVSVLEAATESRGACGTQRPESSSAATARREDREDTSGRSGRATEASGNGRRRLEVGGGGACNGEFRTAVACGGSRDGNSGGGCTTNVDGAPADVTLSFQELILGGLGLTYGEPGCFLGLDEDEAVDGADKLLEDDDELKEGDLNDSSKRGHVCFRSIPAADGDGDVIGDECRNHGCPISNAADEGTNRKNGDGDDDATDDVVDVEMGDHSPRGTASPLHSLRAACPSSSSPAVATAAATGVDVGVIPASSAAASSASLASSTRAAKRAAFWIKSQKALRERARYEVPRLFAAMLQLVNSQNIAIEREEGLSPDAPFRIRLLKSSLYHEEMSDRLLLAGSSQAAVAPGVGSQAGSHNGTVGAIGGQSAGSSGSDGWGLSSSSFHGAREGRNGVSDLASAKASCSSAIGGLRRDQQITGAVGTRF